MRLALALLPRARRRVSRSTAARGAQESPPKHPRYDFRVDARIVPTERAAHVTLELGNGAQNVHRLRFRIDPQRHLLFRGDGEVEHRGRARDLDAAARRAGSSHYVFRIDHLRDARRYDARCAKTWAIFRGEDLVPPARVLRRRRRALAHAPARAPARGLEHGDALPEAARRASTASTTRAAASTARPAG